MKKIIGFSIALGLALCFSSFSTTINSDDNEVSNSEIWKHMSENVFTKLNTLVEYDKESIFSRCPSGFGQHQDKELSNNKMIFGTITFAEGCARDEFCLYKLNWETKKTYLKKTESDEFVAIQEFIKQQKPRTAKI